MPEVPFKVEKGIPIPNVTRDREGLTAFLEELQVGDSFVCSREKDLRNVYSAAKRIGVPIVTRKIKPDQQRVWRVKEEPKPRKRRKDAKNPPKPSTIPAATTPPPPMPPPDESPFRPDMGT